MAFYLPIFSIEAEHTYFPAGRWVGLDFIPASFCTGFIQNLGFVVRPLENGVCVYFDQGRREAFSLLAREGETPPPFVFSVFSNQSLFRTITDLRIKDEASILYFDNQDAKVDAAGRLRLHRAAFVTEDGSEALDSPRIAPEIRREWPRKKRVGVVSIQLKAGTIKALASASAHACQEYYLKFQAKQTFWKYYLLGRFKEMAATIHDLDNETEFEDTGPVVMPNRQIAQTFRSRQRLFLRQRSGYRFQLNEKTANGRRALIKRLPVASAGQFTRERVNGQDAIVSEIFING